MEIYLQLTVSGNVHSDDLQEILKAVAAAKGGPSNVPTPPVEAQDGQAEANQPSGFGLIAVRTEAPSNQALAEQMAADKEERGAPDSGVDAVIAIAEAHRKRAKTVTIDGKACGEGTEVTDGDGEFGVVAACFRGHAVVAYDDGRGYMWEAEKLTLAPQEDTEPAPAEEKAETVTEAEVVTEETTPEGSFTREDIRAGARLVIQSKGSPRAMALILEHGGVQAISAVPEEKIAAVVAALKAEAAA